MRWKGRCRVTPLIPCRDAKGNTVFQIDAAGRLLTAEGEPAEFDAGPVPPLSIGRCRFWLKPMNGKGRDQPHLRYVGKSRSLADRSLIHKFRVGQAGDYLHHHADGTWDLWRPAPSVETATYVA